jgi:DNA-binding transcriptional ArsR family regulator
MGRGDEPARGVRIGVDGVSIGAASATGYPTAGLTIWTIAGSGTGCAVPMGICGDGPTATQPELAGFAEGLDVVDAALHTSLGMPDEQFDAAAVVSRGIDGDIELSVGELVVALGQSQPRVSNHLACLRWCGFVETRREHRSVLYRVADDRVLEVLALGRALLGDNAEHIAFCRQVGI